MNNTCPAHISALTHIRGLTMDAGCLFYSDGFKTCHVVAPFCYLDHSSVSTINTRSAHISASHAAGGEPPLPMHSGATHPCTNSAARAAGGESPPLRAHLGDPHPAQVPQLERPRRAHAPLSQSHKCPRTLKAGWRLPHPGCTQTPRASGDTRLGSHACLTPRTPHICIPSLPLSLAPQGRWQIEKLSGPPMCAVSARNALSRQMHTGFFFFSPVMPRIMASTRSAHWHSYPHGAARATTDAYAAQCSPTPSPPYDPYSIGTCEGDCASAAQLCPVCLPSPPVHTYL